MDRSKWEYKKLGEVCAPKSDILRANKLFGNDDIIDYVDISSIDNTTHSITQPTSYVFKEAPSRAQQKVEQGDILYSLVRPNLKNIAVVTSSDTDKYVASSGFCVLRGKDVETRYLYHLVLGDAFTNYILGLVSGANYPAVREDDVKGFSFRCPPVADQQRIVTELDCLNEMIALKQEQLKEFDKLAQSIFYDMFGDPDLNNKGWDKLKMEDVCEIIAGGDKPDNLSNNKTDEYCYPVIANGDGDKGILGYSRTRRVVKDSVTIGARGASVGNCRIVYGGFTPVVRLISLTPNDLINCIYLYYFAKQMPYFSTGAGQAQLTVPNVKMVTIPLPPLSLQQQFADKISAIEAQKELVKQSITETQKLLDYTMDKYFGYD